MENSSLLAIILAAGKGTRMQSSLPKVLHPIGGRPMIQYIVETIQQINPTNAALVVSSNHKDIVQSAQAIMPNIIPVIQEEQRGTAHAVLSARLLLENFRGVVLILFGDTPLIRQEILLELLNRFKSSVKPAVVILGMELEDPKSYGRIVTSKNNQVEAIVEYKEAPQAIRDINLCNSGVMALDGALALELLEKIKPQVSNQEYYLTDIVSLARSAGHNVEVFIADNPHEFEGANTRMDLAQLEYQMQKRWRQAAMEKGVTFIAPDTVYLSYDTALSADVTVHPYVNFGPKTVVEGQVIIRSYTEIEGATIKKGSIIGPFARLRPGTVIGEGAKIGNFVEVKNSTLKAKAKANHLAYIGDAEVGEETNIGAGTITCNYDGFKKWKTQIGRSVSIGANTSIVAPLKIGDYAYIGAGSTITKDVSNNSLAIGRVHQREIENGATVIRNKHNKASQKDRK